MSRVRDMLSMPSDFSFFSPTKCDKIEITKSEKGCGNLLSYNLSNMKSDIMKCKYVFENNKLTITILDSSRLIIPRHVKSDLFEQLKLKDLGMDDPTSVLFLNDCSKVCLNDKIKFEIKPLFENVEFKTPLDEIFKKCYKREEK